MARPLLFDLTHTSHTRARTGIQRVVRALHRELGDRTMAITHDPYLGTWRTLESWERDNLASDAPGGKRGAQWPWTARLRGQMRRSMGPPTFTPPADCAGFLTAELFPVEVGTRLPNVFPRAAVFHDAIALRFPELSPSGTVARFPSYLRELLAFDGVAAVSDDSRDSLLDYWRWLGVSQMPPVTTIPLGVDPVAPAAATKSEGDPVVLSVGTLEGRKNHLALLEACEQRWTQGDRFTLRLVGAVQSQTGRAALERVRSLQAAGRPLRYDGPLSDDEVAAAYGECAFTVYPSLMEGFGLPVIESLAHGRPCICSARGALGEHSRQGGCVPLDSVDAASLAAAIARLLQAPGELAQLTAVAEGRTFRPWSAYAAEITTWFATLPKRR